MRKCLVLLIAGFGMYLGLAGCGGGGAKNSTSGSGGAAAISVTVTASTSTVDATNPVTLSATVNNDQNTAGVTWSVSGGGTIAGSTAAATYTAPAESSSALTVTVTATSVADPSKTGTAKITIPAAPAMTTNSLASGAVGVAYSATLAANGGIGPYSWSVASGTLPAGLTLGADGAISGTPLAAAAGSSPITFQVTDSGKPNSLKTTSTLAMSITAAPAIQFASAAALADARLDNSYAASIAATGGAGALTYSVGSGSLPAGLMLSPNGAIGGKPTAGGAFTINVRADDAFGDTASQAFTLRVVSPTLTITVPALPTVYAGSNFTPATFSASGGSGSGYSWSVANGSALPGGMTLSSSGILSGKPTSPGTAVFSVTVTDSAGDTATAQTSLVIKPGLTIATASTLPAGDAQAPYAAMLQATGGAGSPYLWSLTNGSSLPAGLTLYNNGTISGTPTTSGTFAFGLIVTDVGGNTASTSFSLTIGNGVIITTGTTLSTTWVGAGFDQALHSVGGTGTGYRWSLASGSALPAGIALAAAGKLSGTPTAAGQFSFGLAVQDSGGNSATATFYLTVNPAITITTPSKLPDASVGDSYTQPLTASGATGSGYIWTVTAGSSALAALGFTVSRDGIVSGTPTAPGSAAFSMSVTDLSLTYATANFSLTVEGASGQVSGTVSLINNCNEAAVPPITLTLSTNPAQTTTTDSSGNYSFPSVPNGTYTLTPSIAGPSAVFYPASLVNVAVTDGAVPQQNFSASLGYSVSGTVGYSGSESGPIYVSLTPTCGNANSLGTSITAPGGFIIRGVPPGTYSAQAWMDNQGFGYPDMADASGSIPTVTVAAADLGSETIALTDPAPYTLSVGPTLNRISPTDQGALISFGAITGTNSSGQLVELPTSYTVQWSTDPEFESSVSTFNFKAGGANGTGVWILNNGLIGLSGSFVDGKTYYFRARGDLPGSHSTWTVFGGEGDPAGVLIGAPSGPNSVTGTVTLSTIPTGPLYVGFFDRSTGQAYTTWFANPGALQPYSLQIPDGNYIFFAVLDRNGDGMIDAGDLSNTASQTVVAISGDSTQDVTLADVHSTPYVTTQHWSQTYLSGSTPVTSAGYGLSFDLAAGDKLPVAVTLTSGPNVIQPLDMAKCLQCGHVQFQYNAPINGVQPQSGDAYTFNVTYNDGTSEQVTGSVSAVLSALPSSLSPAGSSSPGTTPTFTWTDPADSSSYTFSFSLWDHAGTAVWQIPGNNSNSGGFDNPITSIPWGIDPTGSGSMPTVPNLTTGATYTWQVQLQDKNGNSAQTQTYFIP
jgi:hypothetical protein